ncbi:MAG TPA: NAD-dependent epimerase/dehydratase family protein [Sphingobacteriaceae bacterium]|nr:NAD-dependent epimerase/dehydratase family protein [Sphingobacteriaceae bacterium]
MGKIKVGITGQHGFVGTHLTNYLKLKRDIEIVPFDKVWFSETQKLQEFVKQCNLIVHLAALNRHQDPQVIYDTNVTLVNSLISACESEKVTPHILFSSSTQEENDNFYGKSKLAGRMSLEAWAARSGGKVTGLVIPNVFGPFGKPFYNSVVATFCYQLTHDKEPVINTDSEVGLIYVNELIEEIFSLIIESDKVPGRRSGSKYTISPTKYIKVSDILSILQKYKADYLDGGIFPDLTNSFERALFNTFRCYVPEDYFPHPFKLNKDERGVFVEVARTATPGQTSYSTTMPGITRGNHFHTRKAERFAVIQGKARIQLRKIGTDEIINYYLDGAAPSYVDMPIWYTHNITNIGNEELLTLFWINEPYDQADPDTYFEVV